MKQLAILMFALFFIACEKDDDKDDTSNNGSEQTDNNIELTTLSEGHYSGLSGDGYNFMIQTQLELDSIWTIIYANSSPSSDAPEVDFAKELVLLAYMGTYPTGGYSIDITGIELKDGAYSYTISKTSPAEDSVVTTAITAPYHLIRFNR